MSNLGDYQKFTTIAKRFGGVKNFIGLIVTGSAAIGVVGGITAFEGGKKIANKIKTHQKSKKNIINENDVIYRISARGESNDGLKFNLGDEFRVLDTDGDAILIEKMGNANNPYFVDKKLLTEISNYM